MKIICIEYNQVSESQKPSIYLLPGTSILNSNKPFYLPEFSNNIVSQVGLLFRICKVGKYIQPQFAHKYIDAVAIAIQFTALDLYEQAQTIGEPKDIARCFDGSFPISSFISIENVNEMEQLTYDLFLNEIPVISGLYTDLNFKLNELLPYLSKYFIMKIGDYIFIAGGSFSQQLKQGDVLSAFLIQKKMLGCKIK